MIKLILIIVQSFWFIFPAYIANAFPLVLGGGKPADFGKNFIDGNRILGDGKTIRGFFFGFWGGILIGRFQMFLISRPGFPSGLQIPVWGWEIVLLLTVGSLLGDLIASFIKRRLGIRRGQSAPLLDQLDFAIGAILLASMVWLPPVEIIVTILLVTPLVHMMGNSIAFRVGVKSEPH